MILTCLLLPTGLFNPIPGNGNTDMGGFISNIALI